MPERGPSLHTPATHCGHAPPLVYVRNVAGMLSATVPSSASTVPVTAAPISVVVHRTPNPLSPGRGGPKKNTHPLPMPGQSVSDRQESQLPLAPVASPRPRRFWNTPAFATKPVTVHGPHGGEGFAHAPSASVSWLIVGTSLSCDSACQP